MSAALEARAETAKIERLLSADLDFLVKVPAEDLRALREQIVERLFDGDRRRLQPAADAGRLLPTSLLASLGQRALGPMLCARLSGLIDPGRAVEVARHMPPEFLAQLSAEMDPRRATAVIARVPGDLVVATAREMSANGEFVGMGRVVGHLPADVLQACVDAVGDEALLRTAFVLEERDRLDAIVAGLSHERLVAVLRLAHVKDLWPEALSLVEHLTEARRLAVAEAALAAGDDVLDGLLRAAHREDLWEAVLPLAGIVDDDGRRRIAATPALRSAPVLRSALRAGMRDGLWRDLVPLVPFLPAKARRTAEAALAALQR